MMCTMAGGSSLWRQNWDELAFTANYDPNKLAVLCGLSLRQLERRFQRRFGCTPQRWLNERRMNAAQEMLRSRLPIKVIASDLGYKHTSHFCRHFKLFYGLTALQFVALEVSTMADVVRI